MLINGKSQTDKINTFVEVTEKLSHIKDIDSLLEEILFQARRLTGSDAGSIYLVEDQKLVFRYVQNDTLFERDEANRKLIYTHAEMEINERSIAGYVAKTGKSLLIKDAYHLEEGYPFSFNHSFDTSANYRTTSIMTIPLINSNSETIGVMQVLNATDETGETIPYTEQDAKYVSFFANNASIAIERAKMTREMILRMIRMAELRDPKETGAHVNRVAAYTVEIYEKWAEIKGFPIGETKKVKDILRIAAMLHDVGKVSISDAILKKDGKLTDEEYEAMKWHSQAGANLFEDSVSEMDVLSREVALNHHEKWNGKGYPNGIHGSNIPLSARIVAIADVYDALVSKRAYKEPWPEERVLKIIKEEAGEHFDPELVDIFLSIHDLILAIREKYSDDSED